MNDPKARLVDLLEYIEQVEKLKKTAPFKVPNDFFRAFQSDLQGLPGIEFNLVNGGDDVWARISRLTEEAPPEPPESLRAWVSITKSPDKAPELRAEIVVKKDNQQRRLTVDQFPGLRKIFDKYLTDQWTPWASSERVRRKTITLYNKLFAIQQTIEADGGEAALETVWGMGFSVWKKEGAPGTIEYPLLSQICSSNWIATSILGLRVLAGPKRFGGLTAKRLPLAPRLLNSTRPNPYLRLRWASSTLQDSS
jgi:hypothetical protein